MQHRQCKYLNYIYRYLIPLIVFDQATILITTVDEATGEK